MRNNDMSSVMGKNCNQNENSPTIFNDVDNVLFNDSIHTYKLKF